MLVLTRKLGESISINDDITIKVVGLKGHQVKLGIEAPKSMHVHRTEIYKLIQEENRMAAVTQKGLIKEVIDRIGKK